MADRKTLLAVLAAGEASRFGGGKLDAECAGKPLGRWCLDALARANLGPGIVVCGKDTPEFLSRAAGWQVVRVDGEEPALSTSLKTAVRHAIEQRAEALLIILADMPAIGADHLAALAKQSGSAATVYPDGRLGAPAMIARDMFGRLLDLSGDRGAGRAFAAEPDITRIGANPQTLVDVDTQGDLAKAEQLLKKLA